VFSSRARAPFGLRLRAGVQIALVLAILIAPGCRPPLATPTAAPTPTPRVRTPTATATPRAAVPLFQTYAYGELLPDMRVPLQRSATGEGGWYVIIGSEAGWAQFLSQMGQPPEIWEPVRWDKEVLIGALLGVRKGRGYQIAIEDIEIDGVSVIVEVALDSPTGEQPASSWITYPFHFVRVSRAELPLGPVAFRFVSGREPFASQAVDTLDLSIAWISGERAAYPTPTLPPSTSTPVPTATPTPVPSLRVDATVLEVLTDTLTLRILHPRGEWKQVDLMEATSIFDPDGQPASLAQIVPGTVIGALGYSGDEGTVRAAHIDIVRGPVEADRLAAYRPRNVTLATLYDGYSLPLNVDAISSTQPLTMTLNPTQTHVLTRSGFVVVPAAYRSFASLYNDPDRSGEPVFISTDVVLHTTELLVDHALRSVASVHLAVELTELDRAMFDLSWAQYQAVQEATTLEEQRLAATALRNAAYFAVPLSLLDEAFTAPAVISPLVKAELSLIDASQAITISPLLDLPGIPDDDKLRVDYGRFALPGERDATDATLWQAMTWHREIALRPEQREEMRSAALLAHTLNAHPAPRILWERVHAFLAFAQGADASYTPAQFAQVAAAVWGRRVDPIVVADEAQMDAFVQGVLDLPLPENPIWTIWMARQPAPRHWHWLSPAFRIESYIFAQVTGDNVGDVQKPRPLPSLVDLAAVLGSLEAYRIAAQTGDTSYMDYVEQVDRVRNELSALRTVHWTQDLASNWLYIYRTLLREKNASFPSWMRTTAWKRLDLQTAFGSWTHVRRNTPPSGGIGPSVELGSSPAWGYVEPQPEAYAQLAAFVRLVLDGLDSRLLISSVERDALLELETWLIFFQDAARRELTGQVLTEAEHERLTQFGVFVADVSQMATAEGTTGETQPGEIDEAIAVAIAAAQGTERIEATGRVDEIYVVVERDRQPVLARGGVYSHYEWVRPTEEPLTDDGWRQMLDSGSEPPRPPWIAGVVIVASEKSGQP